MSDYRPIPCAQHERLEYAVLKGTRLELRWLDARGEEHSDSIEPTDVTTRDGAEWLSWRNAEGESGCIRLDRILAFREPAAAGTRPSLTR